MSLDPLAGDILRPSDWDDYVGQDKLKEQIDRHLRAAMARFEMPEPVLLCARSGYGKTTLARIIAKRLDVPMSVQDTKVPFSDIVDLLLVEGFSGVLFLD